MTRAKDVEKTYNLQPWYFTVAAYQFGRWLEWYAHHTGDRENADRMSADIMDALRRVNELRSIPVEKDSNQVK